MLAVRASIWMLPRSPRIRKRLVSRPEPAAPTVTVAFRWAGAEGFAPHTGEAVSDCGASSRCSVATSSEVGCLCSPVALSCRCAVQSVRLQRWANCDLCCCCVQHLDQAEAHLDFLTIASVVCSTDIKLKPSLLAHICNSLLHH